MHTSNIDVRPSTFIVICIFCKVNSISMALFGVDLKFDKNGKCSEHSDMDLDTNLIFQTINIPFVTVQKMSPFYCFIVCTV